MSRKCSVLVMLLTLSMVRCMTLQEILDFSSYLERTSLFEKPRIGIGDGVILEGSLDDIREDLPADADPDVPTPDAWELSGKFEGDIILNSRQRRIIVEDVAEGLSRNGVSDITKKWPNNELIYYIQKEHFSDEQIQAIMDGLDDIARASCITHRPHKEGDRSAVVIVGHKRGCFSAVGHQGGYQVLNLSARHPLGRGCFRHGTVVHELLHSLGFYHMQSSSDRDDYVSVLWDNIHDGAKHNFRKYNTFSVSDFGVPYDYDSVLHYSKRAFSKNGKSTLVPKRDGVSIGQRRGMSDGDIEKLNRMYCDKDSGSGSNTNFEDIKEEIKTQKKKKNGNKPFEGHGLGYYKGKSIIVKLPKIETFAIEGDTIEDTPFSNDFSVSNKPENSHNEFKLDGDDKNEYKSDEVFIDIDKIMDDINRDYIHKPVFDAPELRNKHQSGYIFDPSYYSEFRSSNGRSGTQPEKNHIPELYPHSNYKTKVINNDRDSTERSLLNDEQEFPLRGYNPDSQSFEFAPRDLTSEDNRRELDYYSVSREKRIPSVTRSLPIFHIIGDPNNRNNNPQVFRLPKEYYPVPITESVHDPTDAEVNLRGVRVTVKDWFSK